jgi:hypothetical protein
MTTASPRPPLAAGETRAYPVLLARARSYQPRDGTRSRLEGVVGISCFRAFLRSKRPRGIVRRGHFVSRTHKGRIRGATGD